MANEDLIHNFYSDILNQVLQTENKKKGAAEKMLIIRSDDDKWPYVRDFLSCDLEKHRLLEQAAVAAMQNKSDRVLAHISRLYEECGVDQVIDIVRAEIDRDQKMLTVIVKQIKHPDSISFFERRFLQEIRKYMVHQARLYVKVDF